MKTSIFEILTFLTDENYKYEFSGNTSLVVEGFCPLSELKPGSITWIKDIAKFDLTTVADPNVLLFVTGKTTFDHDVSGYNLIITDNPKVIYFEILNRFFVQPYRASGIAPTSVIETKKIGSNVSIGHNCYICEDVKIGDNVTIKNNVVIECPTRIGNDCYIESGVIIGTSGYGYYTGDENRPKKVPDFGGVIIGNRVSIGANTCIARGTLSDTIIGDDVKIDNLCHIAHNVRIGTRSYIIALSMLGGSCIVEEDAYIAPGAMIMNQTTIGRKSLVGMGAVVTKSIEENKVVVGVPGRIIRENR